MEHVDNVQSEEIVPNGKGKVKGKVQKSKQTPKVMMQAGRFQSLQIALDGLS